MGLHAILHVEKTGRTLQHSHVLLAETKNGEAMAQLRGGEVFDRKMVLLCGGEDAGDHRTVGAANAETRAFREEVDTLPLFEVVPALEGAADERDIIGVFVVSLANDARVAVRAAAIVAEGELLQGE